MGWNPGLTKLRDLLAELYPTIQLSREVVEQAGLPTTRIEFSAAATSNWQEILREADRRKKVPAVVAIARQEFPEWDAGLTEAEQEHLSHAGQRAPAVQGEGGPGAPASVPKYNIQAPGATGVAVGDGATVVQNFGTAGVAPGGGAELRLGIVHELLLAAFTPEDLVRLFRYHSNAEFSPVVHEFGPGDGLATLADKAITYCEKRGLLPDLLAEVQRARPGPYARFAPRLWGGEAGGSAEPRPSGAGERELLEQELAQHRHNLVRLRAQKAIYAVGEEPLRLLNQIDHEEAEIERIEAELEFLSAG